MIIPLLLPFIVTFMLVALFTVNEVTATPPIVTAVAPLKPEPVMVTLVPVHP